MGKETITVKSISIDRYMITGNGQKMDKTTFRQIPIAPFDPIDALDLPPWIMVIGYVLDDGKWLVVDFNGEIVRIDIKGCSVEGRPLTDFYPQLYFAE